MNESINVEIRDSVSTSISVRLKDIAAQARGAQASVDGLQKSLGALKTGNLNAIDKAITATARLETAQARAARASIQAATAATQQATATAALERAQSQAALSAMRLEQAQQRAAARIAETQRRALEAANAATTAAKTQSNYTKALNNGTMSQKQYNAAMRGVPAQITDIVTSLQGGQRPLTVLLQQGGQLKDMFGGIGPAARALTTGLIAMITPTTILISAFAGLALAMGKVESEARTVNGFIAQFTATGRGDLDKSFIVGLRKELALLPGVSKSAATSIISEFASVRSVGGPILTEAAKITNDLAFALGTEAPKAAKTLAEALDDPLKGAIALDKQLGFLTIQNFKTIAALDKAGKTAQAQKLLLDLLSKSVKGLAEESMTPLQRATDKLGNSWSKFIGTLSDSKFIQDMIGFVATLVDKISDLIKFLDQASGAWQKFSNAGPGELVSWMRGVPTNTGGATGSWEPAPTATRNTGAQYGQTTKFKTDAAGITGSKDSSAENRATALAKINAQLDNQIKLSNMLGDAREKEEMFDRINEGLIGRKIKLTEKETASLKAKIASIVENAAQQAEANRIYEEAVGPLRTYEASLLAIEDLLKRNVITQAEADKQTTKTFETYANINEPLRQFNIELDQQYRLTKLNTSALIIETKIQEIQNQLLADGVIASATQLDQLRERIALVQHATNVQTAYNAIYDASVGTLENIKVKTEALQIAQQNGIISTEQYSIQLNKLALEAANLKLQMPDATFADAMLVGLGKLTEGFNGVLPGISASLGNFFQSFTDGFADSIGKAVVESENLGEALQNVAKNAVSQLISAIVKLGIQYAVNAAMGNTLAASSAAASVALASTTAAAWAPAAAAVSSATYGTNAIAANAGLASTYALSKVLSSATGFMSGGYTGNAPTNAATGIVHGKEFVVNAAGTSKYRNMLETINSGGTVQAAPSAIVGGSGELNVNVKNEIPEAQYEVRQLGAGDVEIIARRVMRKEADANTAAAFNNPSSKTFKAMQRTTKTERSY